MTKNTDKTFVFTTSKAKILKELTEKYLHLIPKEEKPAQNKGA